MSAEDHDLEAVGLQVRHVLVHLKHFPADSILQLVMEGGSRVSAETAVLGERHPLTPDQLHDYTTGVLAALARCRAEIVAIGLDAQVAASRSVVAEAEAVTRSCDTD